MSIWSARSACWYVRGLPQLPQKLRVTGAVERNSTGRPLVKRNEADGTVTQATTGDPASFRQVRQWQTIVFETSAET